jgi:hypothetical protein
VIPSTKSWNILVNTRTNMKVKAEKKSSAEGESQAMFIINPYHGMNPASRILMAG